MCAAIIFFCLVGWTVSAEAEAEAEAYDDDRYAWNYPDHADLFPDTFKYNDTCYPDPGYAWEPQMNQYRIQWRIYVPKVPRRVIPLMWPSVINPDVFEEIDELTDDKRDEFLEINRYERGLPGVPSITFEDVINATKDYRGVPEPQLYHVYRSMIYWISNEVLKHGFRMIFPQQVNALYAVISNNKYQWLKRVKLIFEGLLDTIGVLHSYDININTEEYDFMVARSSHKRYIVCSPNCTSTHKKCSGNCSIRSTLVEWDYYTNQNFAYWEHDYPTNLMPYLQKYILKSYDIVTNWLFDFVALNLTTDKDTKCTLGDKNKFEIWGFPSHRKGWVKKMEKYLYEEKGFKKYPWNAPHNSLNLKEAMKFLFFTCKLINECTFADRVLIHHGRFIYENSTFTIIPDVLECWFNCSDIPDLPDEYKDYLYWSAALTTSVGYTFAPQINQATLTKRFVAPEVDHTYYKDEAYYKKRPTRFVNGWYEVKTSLVPRVVQKYILDRQRQSCLPCLNNTKKCAELLTPFFVPNMENIKKERIKIEKDVTLFRNGTAFRYELDLR